MILPNVTVVVPTAGRVALTRACLASIQTSSAADRVRVEILIVDSSSTNEQAQLRMICAQLGARLVPGPPSVSEKRNLGAEVAGAEFVMFMDSDCVVTPGCLVAHLETLQDPSVHASQGTILFTGPERLVFRAIRCSGILNAFLPRSGQPIRSAASGNLMVRRAPFLKVRFDPRLGPPGLGGEDVDFGLRLSGHAFRIVGTSTALVCHDTATWNTFPANAKRFFSWGRSEAHLIARHPELSYIDMPSPVLVTLLVFIVSLVTACSSWRALLAFPIGFLSYVVFMTLVAVRHNPEDRLGGALAHWVFFMLDLGRVWESFRRGEPHLAVKRLCFAEDQVTQEWRDLVPTSWAVWIMVVMAIVVLWWSV